MRPRSRLTMSLAIGFAAALFASSGAPAGASGAATITGFRAAEVAAQLARETTVAASLRADTLRKHLRVLTERPHVAGTPADHATAEYVRQRLEAYGWNARIEAVPVYLNYPTRAELEMVEPVRETLATRERGVPGDKARSITTCSTPSTAMPPPAR